MWHLSARLETTRLVESQAQLQREAYAAEVEKALKQANEQAKEIVKEITPTEKTSKPQKPRITI